MASPGAFLKSLYRQAPGFLKSSHYHHGDIIADIGLSKRLSHSCEGKRKMDMTKNVLADNKNDQGSVRYSYEEF